MKNKYWQLILPIVLITNSLVVITSCATNRQLPSALAIKHDLEARYVPQLKPEWDRQLSWDEYQVLTKWTVFPNHVDGAYQSLLNALVITPQGFYPDFNSSALKLTIEKQDLIAHSDHILFKIHIWSAADPQQFEATTADFKLKVNVKITKKSATAL